METYLFKVHELVEISLQVLLSVNNLVRDTNDKCLQFHETNPAIESASLRRTVPFLTVSAPLDVISHDEMSSRVPSRELTMVNAVRGF